MLLINEQTADHFRCHGCSLCVVVCPTWQQTRDVHLTPKACARAYQHQAPDEELALAAEACILCGACEAACPEEIKLVAMMTTLRHSIHHNTIQFQQTDSHSSNDSDNITANRVFIPGPALQGNTPVLEIVIRLLEKSKPVYCVNDIGHDIIHALAHGIDIPPVRQETFLEPLKNSDTIIVDNGLLYRYLSACLPDTQIINLGMALGQLNDMTTLSATDLYVINSRAYHSGHAKKLDYYDALRTATGCSINLDLQRIAQPTMATFENKHLDDAAQIQHILEGRDVNRIIVEELEDAAQFIQACDIPVIHLAEFLDHA